MREATEDDVEQVANQLATDMPLREHIGEQIEDAVTEAIYHSDANLIDGEEVTLSDEQEGEIVRAAISGLFDSLESFDINEP